MPLVFDDPSVVFDINQGVILEASAGSGKTTILTERWLVSFLYLIVWEHNTISEALSKIVALTFTRKAATEMKTRIRARINEIWGSEELLFILENIKKYSGEYPNTLENIIKYLNDQKNIINDLITGAMIATINSFILSNLRSYPLELDLDIGFTPEETGNNISISEKESQIEVFRELLQNQYNDDIQNLFSLGLRLCGMTKWTKILESIRLSIFQYGDQAIENALQNSGYLLYEENILQIDYRKDIFIQIWDLITSSIDITIQTLEKESQYNGKLTAGNSDFYQNLKSINHENLLSLFSKEIIGQYKLPKSVKDEELNELRENSLFSYHYLIDTLYKVIIPIILPISRLCSKKLKEIQKINKEISFSESEIIFVNALQNHNFLKKIQSRIQYFFVDEYQDTSNLQKIMFDKILLKDSIIPFFVGDPKQSIYSFRKANIQVFQQTIKEFQERNFNYKFLNTNYRSAKSHVDFVNYVFSEVFNNDYSNIQYQYQNQNPIKNEEGKFTYTLALGISDEEKYLTQDKLNQAYHDALSLINNYLQRGISPGEIMLLFRNRPSILEFYQFARIYAPDLPLSSSVRDILWDNKIISPILSFLRVLIYPNNSLILIELLKTVFFRKSDIEINLLLIECTKSNVSLFKCLNDQDKMIIEEFIILRDRIPLEELTSFFILKMNYEDILFSLPDAGDSIASLRLFIEEIQKLQERQNMTLCEFINYIDKKKPNINEAEFSGEEGKTLRLMTIHSSKGLESPYVIYVHKTSIKEKTLKYPLYYQNKIVFDILGKGLLAKEIEEIAIQEYVSEEKRVAYVALTRAKFNFDFCSLPSVIKNKNNLIKTQWATFINKELIDAHSLYVNNIRESVKVEKLEIKSKIKNWQEYNNRYQELKEKDEKFQRQEYPQFLSVSLLLDAEFNEENFLNKYLIHSFNLEDSLREISEEQLTLEIHGAKEIGNLVHIILQEFDNTSKDKLQEFLLQNYKEQEEIFDLVFSYVYGYWESEFYKKIKENSILCDKERQVLGILREGIMIRATADLYISANNNIRTIVDYKLSIGKNKERYHRQLAYYALLSEWAGYPVDELVLFSLKEAKAYTLEWDKNKTQKLFNQAVDKSLQLLVGVHSEDSVNWQDKNSLFD